MTVRVPVRLFQGKKDSGSHMGQAGGVHPDDIPPVIPGRGFVQ